MSIVSNIHQFAPLDKDSKPLDGQRLVRIIAKKNREGEYQSEHLQGSLCVSVPWVDQDAVVSVIDKLMPHVMGMVRDTQDKIIREFRIEHGRNEVPGHIFDMNAVVAYLDADAAGDRVTSEYLQEWFMDSYAQIASDWIKVAIDGAAQSVIDAKVNVLRDMFAMWASPRANPNIPQLKAMIRFGAYIGDAADGRMSGYIGKAQVMLARKEAELQSDALGF